MGLEGSESWRVYSLFGKQKQPNEKRLWSLRMLACLGRKGVNASAC
jgi:hypothetical protein